MKKVLSLWSIVLVWEDQFLIKEIIVFLYVSCYYAVLHFFAYVTELPLSGLVRVQPMKRTIIMGVAKGFDSLTPLHKKTGNPLIGETGGLNRALSRDNGPTVCKFET
jgi:hypothetical protein